MLTLSNQLLDAFKAEGVSLLLNSDYISSSAEHEKIKAIVLAAGFYPVISSHKVHGSTAFTLVPYRKPEIFTFFSKSELADLLANRVFKGAPAAADRWRTVNTARKAVLPAVNAGLNELIAKYHRQGQPIIEIGSGYGYTLSEQLSQDLIQVQPNDGDCSLLQKHAINPVYQLNLEELHSLLKGNRRIPTFFALDVFDTMAPAQRTASIGQITSLQGPGDHLLIILDTNPYLNETMRHLEELHPNHGILPYMTATWTECAKLAAMIVPVQHLPGGYKPTPEDFVSVLDGERHCLTQKLPSPVSPLKDKLNLKVVEPETFFAEQISAQLIEAGYSTETKYHASFAVGPLTENLAEFPEDLLYKYVTDTFILRQWSVTDPNLHKALAGKGLALPSHFDASFVRNLKENGLRIYGAEFLVLAATKN